MITLNKAIEIAKNAHEGKYRKPKKVFPVNEHTLSNYELSKLQQNNGTDFTICKEDGEYSMNAHLELFISEPYITHPLAVMEMMGTEEEKIVAVLHDVVEDCKGYYLCEFSNTDERYLTKENNNEISLCLTKEIYEALVLLTHSKDISYSKYVIDIRKNKLATKVKLADIFHNMSCEPSEHAKQKYFKAIPVLLKGI